METFMTDAQKKMRELSANLKPAAELEIPTRLSQPPLLPHPALNPDGSVKE
jgi:hypothetical protein